MVYVFTYVGVSHQTQQQSLICDDNVLITHIGPCISLVMQIHVPSLLHISFLDVLIQCLIPRVSWLLRYRGVSVLGVTASIFKYAQLDWGVESLDGLTGILCSSYWRKYWGPWILKRFCVFLMLVLELFGGKPQALSSGKTNMAMEYEAIFSKICWRWWFHIEKRWKLSPSLPFVDLPEIVSPSPHYSWVTPWW